MKSVNPKQEPGRRPADKPGRKTGWFARSWLGRHPRLALIALATAGIAAAWGGWRHFSRPLIKIEGIRNVVLISIDTCRADRLSCYGYKRQTTPNIDALASNGVLFTSASTPVPFTLPAHSSMMTGTYPPTHGVRLNNGDHLADSNITLAEIMRDAGYQTAAFIGAFPLDRIFGLNQGFDTYDCQFRAKRQMALYSERNAEELTGPAMDWLGKNGKKPFLLFLHYYDAHFPYEPPPPFNTTYAGDLYAGEIAYVDRCIGHVVDQLHAMGIYDNTLIIITGDHGESLGEHGEQTHGFFMYQGTLRVPLVIRAPVGSRNCQVNDNVSLVDIVPT
ncbi:MAG: sulfatase, partial [Planctomycetota bacterium]